MTGEFKEIEDIIKIVTEQSIEISADQHEPTFDVIQKETDSVENRPKQVKSSDSRRPSERNSLDKVAQTKEKKEDDLTPASSLYPRNWGGAMLTFVTANVYQLLLIQVFQVIHGGGIESWLELIKFNFLEIVGMVAFGPAHQIAQHWQAAGALQSLLITLVIYWSLFLIYPIAIFGFPADGRVFSRRRTFKGKLGQSLIVLFGLAVFIPLPCIRYWRLSKSDQEKFDQNSDSMSNLQVFPEILAVISELSLLSSFAHQLLIHLTLGQTHFRWESLIHNWWTVPVGHVILALVFLHIYKIIRRSQNKKNA